MKIVIELGDTLYNFIKEHKLMVMDLQTVEKAIKNGTPLPEGHGRLIDADKLLLNCHCMFERSCNHKNCSTCQFYDVAKYEVEESLTILEADKDGE